MSDAQSGRRVVDGRFQLVARLGGGGMGMVWRAHDLVLQRSVAVKEVRPPDVDLAEYDPEGARMLRERVLREARALARVDHPNVVTIYHIVDNGEGTNPWIVMELVEGGSLADRLGRGPMDPAEAARLGRELLSALRAAHAAGVEHRDVKPANVLLRRDGRPVLTDFGIAAVQGSTTLTATGSIIGTPDYMAPERVSGNPGGPEADLWSLAMMLYVAVEGHHPLRRGTTLATLAAVLYDDVPPPSQAGPLTAVLTRVLVRDPAARPDAESVDRMLAAAEAGTGGSTAGTHTPTPTSYPLAPPGPPTEPPTAARTAPSGFGPPASATGGPWSTGPHTGPTPPPREPRDAVPFAPPAVPADAVPFAPPAVPADAVPFQPPAVPADAVPPVGHSTTRRRPRPPRRGTRNTVVALSAVGTVVVGGLVWQMLPGGQLNDAKGSLGATSTPRDTTSTPTAAASRSDEGETSDEARAETTGLLTPSGIRTAIKAIEKKTGRDTYGSFSVYPDHVSANVMVAGNRTAYEMYTYRVDGSAEKGIITGKLIGGEQPFSLKDFNWDAVPSLLAEAKKRLKVAKPTSRYLLVREPNSTFDTPAAMAIYLDDELGTGGYMEADPQGDVTKTMADEE